MTCRWLSIRPGIARRPLRSMTLVSGPLLARISAAPPTALNLPAVTATASGPGVALSSVVKRPLIRMRSGCMKIPSAVPWDAAVPQPCKPRARAAAPVASMSRRRKRFIILVLVDTVRGVGLEQILAGQRGDLLTGENSEQPRQGDHRRRRRSHMEEAVDQADEETDAKREQVWLHGGDLPHPGRQA